MTENPFAIELTGVTKRYADTLATDSISFRVRETEFFGLLGPNGAGKTTTINMLTGLLPITSGTAKVNGKDVKYEMGQVNVLDFEVLNSTANEPGTGTFWQPSWGCENALPG